MITLKEIKEQVENNVAVTDIASRGKKQQLPIWRGMYCKLACVLTDFSLREVGEPIGRSHSTVVYWRREFPNLFLTRPDIEKIYYYTLRQLQEKKWSRNFVMEMDEKAESIINSMVA